jgi:hypothetical protein
MPVLVKCDCGKQLQVPDQYVGKPVKCPGCQKVHIAQAPARTEPEPQPAMLRFNCSCGQLMQVKAEYAGRATKCPACGKVLTIPGGSPAKEETTVQPQPSKPAPRDLPAAEEEPLPSVLPVEEEEDEPPPRKSARRDLPAEDEEEEDEPRPRRRPRETEQPPKGRRRFSPWVLIASAVGLLIGLGLGIWLFFFSGPSGDLALVPADAQGFVTIRAAELWKSVPVQDAVQAAGRDVTDALTSLEQATGFKPEDIERVTVVVKDATVKPPSLWVIVTAGKPWDSKKVLEAAGMPMTAKNENGVGYHVAEGGSGAFCLLSPKTAVFAPTEDALKACLAQQDKPTTKGPLAQAIKQVGSKDHIAGGFAIPQQALDPLRQQVAAAGPLAGKGTDALDIECLWLAGNFNGKDLQVELTGAYPSSDKAKVAKELCDSLKVMAPFFLGQLGDAAFIAAAGNFLDNLSISQSGSNVIVKAKAPLDLKQLGGVDLVKGLASGRGVGPVGMAADQQQAMNNLRQLSLALLDYHEALHSFPTSVWVNPETQEQYSWRVAILPFIEQQALYTRILENGAWDSPANQQLAAQMPKAFELPGKPAGPGKTFYQAFAGPRTMFGPMSLPPGQPSRGNRIFQVTDGTSNTLAIVEGAEAVDWMKPGSDIPFEPGPRGFPVAKLGNHWRGKIFLGAFFDGTVRTIPRTIDPKLLQALITHNGGEVIPEGFDK